MSRISSKMWLQSRLGFIHQSNKDSLHIMSSRMLMSSEAVTSEVPEFHSKFQTESEHQSTGKLQINECNDEANGTGLGLPDFTSQSFGKFSLDYVLVRKWLEDHLKSLEHLHTELNEQRNLLSSIYGEVLSLRIRKESGIISSLQTKQDLVANLSHSISTSNLEAVNTRIENHSRINEAHYVEIPNAKYTNDARESEDQGIDALSRQKELDDTSGDMTSELKGKFIHPDWPEWISFLNILRNLVNVNDGELTGSAGVPDFFSDATRLKRALVKFAQAHDSIIEHLSCKDLRALLRYETPINDERTNIAKERLQTFLQCKDSSNDKTVKSNQISLSSSDQLRKAKLTDVMRIVYRVLTSAHVEQKSAIIHLLQDFVSLSGHKNCNSLVDMETSHTNSELGSRESSNVQNIKSDKQNVKKNKPSKHLWNVNTAISEVKGLPTILEWKCPRCSFTNLPQKTVCTQCGETSHSSIACEPIIEENTEPRKYNSLKERVEARKARLEMEQLQKQIANPQSSVVSPNSVDNNIPKETTVRQTKCVSKNFKALDELIESDSSDYDDEQDGQRAPSLKLRTEDFRVKKNGHVFSKEAQFGNDDTTDDDGIHAYGLTGGRRYGTHQHELMFQRGCYSEQSKLCRR